MSMDDDSPRICDILDRLRAPAGNPVTRARWLVECQVPQDRRGPGWDRHWRELAAYLDSPVHWSGARDDGMAADEDEDTDDDL